MHSRSSVTDYPLLRAGHIGLNRYVDEPPGVGLQSGLHTLLYQRPLARRLSERWKWRYSFFYTSVDQLVVEAELRIERLRLIVNSKFILES